MFCFYRENQEEIMQTPEYKVIVVGESMTGKSTYVQNMNGQTGAFWKAALWASSYYHNHPLTTTLTDDQVSDWKFWLPMDLFEWRWAKKIRELFPWWQFTHNTDGHYMIVPAEYVDPEERWKLCESTLRQPTFHTMYNLPNDEEKITYWDVYMQFSNLDTADEVTRDLVEHDVHPEVRQFIMDRGCPEDMGDFVWRWAEDDRELTRKWQKWAERGIEDHIIAVTEKITGITMEDCMKKDTPPPLRRRTQYQYYLNRLPRTVRRKVILDYDQDDDNIEELKQELYDFLE